MSRRKSREQAFALLFEKSFNDLPVEELAEGALDAREIEEKVLATGAMFGPIVDGKFMLQSQNEAILKAVTEAYLG